MRVEDLAYWINEREHMRIKREETDLPPPWSADPLLATVRYCNVRREDDKVTRWIAKHWRAPLASSPYLTLAMAAARFINWPDTLEEIQTYLLLEGKVPEWLERIRQTIKIREAAGCKVWSSAYIVSTNGRRMKKEDYIVDHVLKYLVGMRAEMCYSLSGAHATLMSINGIGSFMAGQIVADLKNAETPLKTAPDWWAWACPGPGSLRGLAAFYGAPRVLPGEFLPLLHTCYAAVKPHLYPYVGELHMQDFQNCLCEFSKFIRVRDGDGRARNRYTAC